MEGRFSLPITDRLQRPHRIVTPELLHISESANLGFFFLLLFALRSILGLAESHIETSLRSSRDP